MASVGEFTVLISRVGYTMARTPLGVLGDFPFRELALVMMDGGLYFLFSLSSVSSNFARAW